VPQDKAFRANLIEARNALAQLAGVAEVFNLLAQAESGDAVQQMAIAFAVQTVAAQVTEAARRLEAISWGMGL
jgi:hypothetical protein